MTTRAITLLAGLVAVVAGISTGIGWISDHVPGHIVWGIGSSAAVFLTAFWIWMAVRSHQSGEAVPLAELGPGIRISTTGRYVLYALVSLALIPLVMMSLDASNIEYRGGFMFTAVALLPIACELVVRDAQSRTRCPDCREDIRADANVCKHCGFRLGPKPEARAVVPLPDRTM